MNKKARHGGGVPQIVFGALVILLGLILALTPIGSEPADRGISGALNMPGWLLGLAILPFGIGFVWLGVRGLRSK